MTYVINGVKTTLEEFLRIAREAQLQNTPKFTHVSQTLNTNQNEQNKRL
jgi:hypothetical protein